VVAWVRYRGLGRLREELGAFSARGGESRIILGIDEGGATRPGLLGALRSFTEAYVFHDRSGGTFHPKIYLAEGDTKAVLRVGSSNLTPGGLFFNDEASLEIEFDLPADANEAALVGVHEYIDHLLGDGEACKPLSEELIEQLVEDPRYRVSGTERRTRRTDVPLPPGAEEEDVTADDEGEEPAEEGVPPLFGTSTRHRSSIPGLSAGARAELAELEKEEDGATAGTPPVAPPPQPPAPPAAATPPSPGTPPGGPTIVESWSKELSRADAQQPTSPGTNPTGVLRLSKAGHDINWRTWFRQLLYGSATWAATTDSHGNPTETATIPMEVSILGVSHGAVNVRVDHAPHREAGQHNVPTILHWGTTLGAILRATDYTGRKVSLSWMSDGSYRLEIT
jgi:hypothetical protein